MTLPGLVLRAKLPSTHTLVAVCLCPSWPSSCQKFKLLELAATLRPRDLLCTEGKERKKKDSATLRTSPRTRKGRIILNDEPKVLQMVNISTDSAKRMLEKTNLILTKNKLKTHFVFEESRHFASRNHICVSHQQRYTSKGIIKTTPLPVTTVRPSSLHLSTTPASRSSGRGRLGRGKTRDYH